MIHKSYLIEQNLNLLKNNIALFYGENSGLIQDFKEKIAFNFKEVTILKYSQEEILANQENFFTELKNISLFDDQKIFFLHNISDKFLNTLNSILANNKDNKIYLFSGILEKKSKIRNFFEKEKTLDIVPCYQDNNLTLRNLIINSLEEYKGLSTSIIDLIVSYCGNDRAKINNEIDKIKIYFDKKIITEDILPLLLNLEENDDFNLIKDASLCGDKLNTNKFINSTIIEPEKSVLYLSTFNQRILKIKEVINSKESIENAIAKIKPPIFWKDKPKFMLQAKKWNASKINKAFSKIYDVELKIKSNTLLDKKIILKKLIIDICNLANAA